MGRVFQPDPRGFSLVLVLLLISLGGALAAVLVLLSAGESVMAARDRASRQARAAADAVLERAVAELRLRGDWNPVLAGLDVSALRDLRGRPVGQDGRPLDLGALTVAVQRRSDLQALAGPDRPAWRLFAYGPMTSAAPAEAPDVGLYVVAWVADDEGDGDGNPGFDANGIVQVWAEAHGPGSTRRGVRAAIARLAPAPDPLRLVWWRTAS